MARLGDYVKIRTGRLDANASSENGQYPFFTCSVEPLKIDTYSYDCECVLVAGNGDLNVKYYNGKFDAYQRTYIIESIDKSILSVPYLYCFLNKYVETLRKQAIGGVIKYIKLGNLTEAQIPLFSLEEQERIVDIIDKVNQIITNRKQQLQQLDELVKARFVEMFGDPVSNPHGFDKVALSELADIKIGPFGSLLHKEDYIEGGYALLNPSHIIDGKIAPDSKLTVSTQKYEELSAYHLKTGDVVLGRRGEMGRCAVVPCDGYLCGTGSLLIRTKGEVTADYIQKVISFPSFKKTIEEMAVGQTMPNLNVPIVSSFQIIKPPIEVQESYYAFVEQVDKSKFAVQKALDEAQTLFDSLMQEYFG
ncbi:MAG: restriction endonuclease subunit S [Clostridia bacterium]|nr:restriction endonuclease subunit S [Clostridia bacterium]